MKPTTETAPDSRRKRASNPNRGAKPGERRGGRQKGTPNKVTRTTKEAITELVDGAAPKLAGWLDAVAKDDPRGALEIVARMASLVMPRPGIDASGGLALESIIVMSGVPASGPEHPSSPASPVPRASCAASNTPPAAPIPTPVQPAAMPVSEALGATLARIANDVDGDGAAATEYDPFSRN